MTTPSALLNEEARHQYPFLTDYNYQPSAEETGITNISINSFLLEKNVMEPGGKSIGKIIYVSLSGSRLYNTNTSTTVDTDVVGIFAAPAVNFFVLNPSQVVPQTITNNLKPTTGELGKLQIDYYLHELVKFCTMLLDSNPTGIELIFGNEAKVYACDKLHWPKLLQMRSRFLTKTLVKRYIGFAKQQIMIAVKKMDQSEEKAARKALYTAYRAASEAFRLVKGKEPKVCWKFTAGSEETEAEDVHHYKAMMDIKKGNTALSPAQQQVQLLLEAIEKLKKSENTYIGLPEDVSNETKQLLNEWVVGIRLESMKEMILSQQQ